jgi:hypothetical protein
MSRQWKRSVEVIVGKDGEGVSIANLRIKFTVTKTVDSVPNSCVITIYNLNFSNESKIETELKDLIVKAGYVGEERLIFTGNIKYVYKYRDTVDRILEIEGGDGDEDYKSAIVNHTFAAGTSDDQVISKAIESFKSTKKGYISIKPKTRRRGKSYSGNTRNLLNQLSDKHDANWSIQDGELVIVEDSEQLPDEAIVINSETGMIGAPEINDRGISVTCLLNPKLRVNGVIQLDNNSIKPNRRQTPKLANSREKQEAVQQEPVRESPDGLYKVVKLTHKGDTRGNEWFSEIECISIDSEVPKSR